MDLDGSQIIRLEISPRALPLGRDGHVDCLATWGYQYVLDSSHGWCEDLVFYLGRDASKQSHQGVQFHPLGAAEHQSIFDHPWPELDPLVGQLPANRRERPFL